jgi:hypothetical protein
VRSTSSVVTALALFAGVACTDITSLKQENQGALSVSTLYVPANAQLLVNGTIADFECAYNRYVVGVGLFTDELTVAISQSANFDYDARRVLTASTYGTANCGSPTPSSIQQPGIYTPLSVARATADTAVAYLQSWTDAQVANRQKLIGQAATYGGYDLVLLGEAMCTAAINLGPELQPAQVFTEAIARFTTAIAAATAANDATTLNLARLGRARAELDLGGTGLTLAGNANLTAAAADAALIPASFTVTTSPDAVNPRRQNVVFLHIAQSSYSTVDTAFRHINTPGDTSQDPRVAVTNLNRKGTTGSPLYIPNKDATVTSPVRVASYAEAQLIIAENAARTGDLNGAVTAINNARARTAGVPMYTLPAGATGATVLAQVIDERRREFFVEGHRLGDLRRYGLPFLPAAGTPYQFGGNYGTQTCLPLPDVERINNPTIAGAGT